jgi:hypothetical protein
MNISDMTKKEIIEAASEIKWESSSLDNVWSLIIIPGGSKDLHDSGFRVMRFVALDKFANPICIISGSSDVIHIGGIFTQDTIAGKWSIDCLRKSGLLRIFSNRKLKLGDALSSFEVMVK